MCRRATFVSTFPEFSPAQENSKKITDNLLKELQANCNSPLDLEPILQKWSVESTLAALFGSVAAASKEETDKFVQSVHQIFVYSALLQTQDAEKAAKFNSEEWQKFSQATNQALSFNHFHIDQVSEPADRLLFLTWFLFERNVQTFFVVAEWFR